MRVLEKQKVLSNQNEVIIPDVYNPDWNAYLNGTKKVKVYESVEKTRQVQVENDTKFVDFKYEPFSFF